MSLLSDLLSKIRQPQPKKDVPPNLKSIFASAKKAETKRKRLAFLFIFFLIIVGSGFAAVYVFDKFSESEHQKRLIIAKKAEREASENKVVKHEIKELKNDEQDKKNKERISKDDGDEKNANIEPPLKSDTVLKASPRNGDLKRKKPQPPGQKIEDAKISEATPAKKDIAVAEARTTLNPEITKPDTSEKDLYLYQARDYESRGMFHEAVESYKKILNIESKNYRVVNNVGSILIKLKSYGEAISYLQKAIELKSDYVPAIINMAIALACVGQYHDSERHLLKAMALEPSNREALFNLGILYERQGNVQKARDYFTKLKQAGDKRGEAAVERLRR